MLTCCSEQPTAYLPLVAHLLRLSQTGPVSLALCLDSKQLRSWISELRPRSFHANALA
jgi:hypothetical protein